MHETSSNAAAGTLDLAQLAETHARHVSRERQPDRRTQVPHRADGVDAGERVLQTFQLQRHGAQCS